MLAIFSLFPEPKIFGEKGGPQAGFPNGAINRRNPDGSYSVTAGTVVAVRPDGKAFIITVAPNSGESILVRPDGTFEVQSDL